MFTVMGFLCLDCTNHHAQSLNPAQEGACALEIVHYYVERTVYIIY